MLDIFAFRCAGTGTQQPHRLEWWLDLLSHSQERNQIITYTVWNVWKERCRRFYDNKAFTALQLTSLIRQDVAVLSAALIIPVVN